MKQYPVKHGQLREIWEKILKHQRGKNTKQKLIVRQQNKTHDLDL